MSLTCFGKQDQEQEVLAGNAPKAFEDGGHILPQLLAPLSILAVQVVVLRRLGVQLHPAPHHY